MKIVKQLLCGALGGLVYAFVSFYLVTPYLKGNWPAIAFWGFQGLLFAAFFIVLKSLVLRRRASSVIPLGVVGAVSGLLSSGFAVSVTYYNAILSFDGVVASELRKNILSELFLYSMGCLVLGLSVGMLVGYKHGLKRKGA